MPGIQWLAVSYCLPYTCCMLYTNNSLSNMPSTFNADRALTGIITSNVFWFYLQLTSIFTFSSGSFRDHLRGYRQKGGGGFFHGKMQSYPTASNILLPDRTSFFKLFTFSIMTFSPSHRFSLAGPVRLLLLVTSKRSSSRDTYVNVLPAAL
jgi:hypothetical protein